jgi:hypothetical protein
MVKGDVDLHASKSVRLFANERVSLELVEEDLSRSAHISYNKDDKIWEIFGESTSAGQSAILGDDFIGNIEELFDLLSDLSIAISTLTVTSSAPGAPSSPPINPVPYAQFQTKISLLKTKIKGNLSKRVKID